MCIQYEYHLTVGSGVLGKNSSKYVLSGSIYYCIVVFSVVLLELLHFNVLY